MTEPTEPPGQAAVLGAAVKDLVRRTGASAGLVYLLPADPDAADGRTDGRTDGAVLRLAWVYGLPSDLLAPWRAIPMESPVPVARAVRDGSPVWVGGQEDMARRFPRVAAVLPYRFALAAVPIEGRTRYGGLVVLWPAGHPSEALPGELDRVATCARTLAAALDRDGPPRTPPDAPPVNTDGTAGRSAPGAAGFADRLPGASMALDLNGRTTFLSTGAARLLGARPDDLYGRRPWQVLSWLENPALEEQCRRAVISREPAGCIVRHPDGSWLRVRFFADADGISVRITSASSPAAEPPVLAAPGPPMPGVTGRLYQVAHLAAALTEVVGVRDVVELVAGQVLPAFGAQGLVLSVADAGRLRITGHHGYPSAVIRALDGLPLDTVLTPAGQVLADGTPLFFENPEAIALRYPDAAPISGKQAWAFLPLTVSARPVGCCIISYDHPHAFTSDERAVLTSLAGLIAQAVERAHLYDVQHALARDLQHALLPHGLPPVPGLTAVARYLPATYGAEVGGDFYDLIRLGDHCAASVIGDVQGHNAPAAAIMGQIRTSVHAHAATDTPPGQVLARTNHLLAELGTDLLASCLYARLDLARGTVELASAGHAPPLLRRPDGHTGTLDLESGPLLGVDTDAHYPVTTFPLPPGALLVLYTDGLVEHPGTDTEDNTRALAAHLALTGTGSTDLDTVADGTVRHASPTGHHTDDIALLLLRTAV
ncbi:SpoIIE family protein phosphatase [Kitasatospora sp. NPDC054939]